MVRGHLSQFLKNNKIYAPTHVAPPKFAQVGPSLREKGDGVIIITCSDARVHPYKVLGLGDAPRT
jgi:carbonic anhydrase